MARWPDDPLISIQRTPSITPGDAANVSKLSCGVHTGTQVDAPLHFRGRAR
jgi:arylformamidase